MYYYIDNTKEFGRGIYSGIIGFERHEVICVCETVPLSKLDTNLIKGSSVLKNYTFKYNEDMDCLVLGDGSLFNHSSNPNVSFRLDEHPTDPTRKMMYFYALTSIKEGEQMFIDYTSDDKSVDIEQYFKGN